jgi:hypothetical protein
VILLLQIGLLFIVFDVAQDHRSGALCSADSELSDYDPEAPIERQAPAGINA